MDIFTATKKSNDIKSKVCYLHEHIAHGITPILEVVRWMELTEMHMKGIDLTGIRTQDAKVRSV